MIHATIAGRIGRDAETRDVRDRSVTNFSLATERKAKGEKIATWVRCALWGRRGEALAPYLAKGATVTVVGALSMREHEGRTYLECDVSDVALQGGSGGGRQDRRDDDRPSQGHTTDLDDEIPF